MGIVTGAAEEFMRNAEVQVGFQDFPAAYDQANQAAKLNPGDWRVWFLLAKIASLNFTHLYDDIYDEENFFDDHSFWDGRDIEFFEAYLEKAYAVAGAEVAQLEKAYKPYKKTVTDAKKIHDKKLSDRAKAYVDEDDFIENAEVEELDKSDFEDMIEKRDALIAPRKMTALEKERVKLMKERYGNFLDPEFDDDLFISSGAFSGCKCKTVSLPNCGIIIAAGAFLDCENLEGFEVRKRPESPAGAEFFVEDGVLFHRQGNNVTLVAFPAARKGSYTVPGTVTDIYHNAFARSSLSEITISGSTRRIGSYAIGGASIKKVTVTVKGDFTINSNAFYKSGLESMVITSAPKLYIGPSAFAGSRLSGISFPEAVDLIIHAGAFKDTPIKEFVLPHGTHDIFPFAFSGKACKIYARPTKKEGKAYRKKWNDKCKVLWAYKD